MNDSRNHKGANYGVGSRELVRRLAVDRHAQRRFRHERRDAEASLLAQMWKHTYDGINGPRRWWEKIILTWAYRKLVPCWHWDKMPEASKPNTKDEPRP